MAEQSGPGGSGAEPVTGCVVRADGTREWFLNGQRHRVDGPAIEGPGGYEEWFLHGQRHRDEGPAVVWADGTLEWFVHGERHREGSPAVVSADGSRWWYLNGRVHREDGPAAVLSDGSEGWWAVGHKVAREVVVGYVGMSAACKEAFVALLDSGANPSDAFAAARELSDL